MAFAAYAESGRGMAAAFVRPGRQLQPLRGQGGAAAARRSPRLLLLHADALCLAHASVLFRSRPQGSRLGTVLERLRQWDRRTAAGVTHFLAISQTVRRRIEECYNRESTVIYPPVDTDFYCPADRPPRARISTLRCPLSRLTSGSTWR